MKKIALILIFAFVFLSLPLFLTGCKKEDKLNLYAIDCIYDQANKTLTCSQQTTYVNNSNNLLKEVKFHLYPNAFRQESKAKVVSQTNETKAYPNGKSYGKIEITNLTINDHVKSYEVGGEDQNILTVYLNEGIYPDEQVKIEMEYIVSIPNINHRFGYGKNTVNLGNFYPIACVYEEGKGFVQDLYHSNGDPFYSDVSNYQVKITYPKTLTIASTGEIKNNSDSTYSKTTVIDAKKVRDFAFVLSDIFEVKSESVDGIIVNYYYYDDDDVTSSMRVAVQAMKTFNSLFGKYPYKSVSVVKSNFVHGGMEFPNLVLISDASMTKQEYEYVIVHELAHQWWYGVVGNNEYQSAWLDEGLTEYSAALFYENNKEYNVTMDKIMDSANKQYKLFYKVYSRYTQNLDTSMNRRLDQFETEPEYVNCTYTKGLLLFDTYRRAVGDKKFFKSLKHYYSKYMYKNASAEDFVACMMESCGYDLENFFEDWLYGKVAIF